MTPDKRETPSRCILSPDSFCLPARDPQGHFMVAPLNTGEKWYTWHAHLALWITEVGTEVRNYTLRLCDCLPEAKAVLPLCAGHTKWLSQPYVPYGPEHLSCYWVRWLRGLTQHLPCAHFPCKSMVYYKEPGSQGDNMAPA